MVLDEAIMAAMEGHFVSNNSFDSKQSMHSFNDRLYYEDGADLTTSGFVNELKRMDWAKDGWYIKYKKERVNINKLKEMHENNKYMLQGDSYEDCIEEDYDGIAATVLEDMEVRRKYGGIISGDEKEF
jgi:hypothetical protein